MLTLPSPAHESIDWPAYRPYRATVKAITRLTPHFTRVTFSGPQLLTFTSAGSDQRIKILFPIAGLGLADIGADDAAEAPVGDWHARWRALADDRRNPFRTYTIRGFRPESLELDVDFVAHGDGGPAAQWLQVAGPGAEVLIVGPDIRSSCDPIGLDWRPGTARELLLIGDETAAPAICAILETLPHGSHAHAFIEVPSRADVLPVDSRASVTLHWLPRDEAGPSLETVLGHWLDTHRHSYRTALAASAVPAREIDVDRQLLWESPAPAERHFYAWLAGESALIKSLRRMLVTETGIDRSSVAFMGYWRSGKAEAQS